LVKRTTGCHYADAQKLGSPISPAHLKTHDPQGGAGSKNYFDEAQPAVIGVRRGVDDRQGTCLAAAQHMATLSSKIKICTSHVERMNGSIRLFNKRLSRLTYAFSKRWDKHRAALSVFFCHYNYCRKHSSLNNHTPAMAHGLATEVWSVRKMIETVTA
jgi:transposase InsO family protein